MIHLIYLTIYQFIYLFIFIFCYTTWLEKPVKLTTLRPVNFTCKSDDKASKQYGLIAEEIEKVKPEFVSYDNNGNPETVSYSSLISPLLKALQEQKSIIEKQQKQIDDLMKRMEALSAK